MNDDHTQHQPVEPTTPVPPPGNPYTNPYASPYVTGPVGMPPPPPTRRRVSLGLLVVCLIIAVLLFLSAGLFYLARTYAVNKAVPTPIVKFVPVIPTTQPTPTPTTTPRSTPAITQNYTARTIFAYMQAADNTVAIESTGKTVWTFSHDNYFVNPYATSSFQFTACPLYCTDTSHFGLWVYASQQDAMSAYNQVHADSLSCTDTSPAADGMYVSCGYPEQEYAHGRCLLLNAIDTSVYGQVVTRYCI